MASHTCSTSEQTQSNRDIPEAREFIRVGITFHKQFMRTGVLSDVEGAIKNFQQAVSLTPDDHSAKPVWLSNLGASFQNRFWRTGTLSDLEEAVRCQRQAVSLTPDGNVDKPGHLDNLGIALHSQFQRTGILSDLEEAIVYQKQVVSLTAAASMGKARRLNNLGVSLLDLFGRTGKLSDLEEAIEVQQQAVLRTPDRHPGKPGRLDNLGLCLKSRFEHTGALSDLEEAIKSQQYALLLTPDGHPNKAAQLSNLGSSLESRFKRSGTLSDLEEAIGNQQQALSLIPDDHADRSVHLNNLGLLLRSRFEHTGVLDDLEEAIRNQRQGLLLTPDDHPDKLQQLHNLGNCLDSLFEHTGTPSDLDEAITIKRQALLLTPDGHPNRPRQLSNLGVSLRCRFDHAGTLSDLEEAIRNQQQAVSLTADGHLDKPRHLAHLGNSFLSRFGYAGVLSDIEEAIKNHQQAVLLTPDGDASKPGLLNSLGVSFQYRFLRTGMPNDLEEAIRNEQQAVSLTPDGDPHKPRHLANLGISLETRFGYAGAQGDLRGAIKTQQQAVACTPDGHPEKPSRLTSLGLSLHSQFKSTGTPSDLEEAIEHLRQAVSLTPDDHPDKPQRFNSLGIALESRFGSTGILSDLDEAIENQQRAVSLTPDDHPNKPQLLTYLGNSFQSRFRSKETLGDLDEAVSHFRLAATAKIGRLEHRFHSAQQWARLEAQRDPTSALVAYQRAIDLIQQMAWIGDPIATRHSHLTNIDDIPREAASFALDAGRPDLAFEWLEQGRSVVWNQLLNLRTSVDDLRQAHPDICAEFTQVSHALQGAVTRAHIVNASDDVKISLEAEIRRHHRLAERRDSLVERIRSLPGFENFLLPKTISALMQAANSGPVVVINVHQHRCDALVLRQGETEVLHIPLDKLRYEDIEGMQKSLKQYLIGSQRAQRSEDRTGGPVPMSIPRMVRVLEKIFSNIVYPILQGLGITASQSDIFKLPHIWWCPTGPLTFLPLHAACRKTGSGVDGIFNYAVSSYIPTVHALLEARAVKRQPFSQLIGIAMTNTPCQSPLPGVNTEMAGIGKLLSDGKFEVLRNEEATSEQVLAHMTKSSWIHLACHAVQDQQEPTRSGFRLYDRRLMITDIIAKPFANADFAFLSACQTATGDEKASDEVVHITGAMLGAGYRNVIGTMWAIPDEAAPIIAEKVYEILLSGEEANSDGAAGALHEAVKKVRESSHDLFDCWVPFVHYGA